ncbi:PCI domain-containing protein 2 isoform X3 [Meles meles]|nr:PCI domain-containing protein 2 isoform X3 [Meles meles]XP_045833973.1 PCI domain-containing protein 2 isoform X3 [Meles meles]
MFAAHLRCTYAVGNHDFIEAYKCQTVIVQSFLRAFQAHKEENWALPVMYAVALDLRVFANNADQQLAKKGKSRVGDMLEKAAELLMSCFRVCASDTRAGIEDSKKWGMLFLVNQLFKIYFKLEPQGRLQHRAEGDVQVLRRAQGHVRQRLQASGGVPVLRLRALPPCESEEQKDDSDIFASSQNAAGSHADHRAAEEVPSHAVRRSHQSRQRRRPPAPERGADEARDLLHPLWHLPHPREAEDHHLQEPFQESVPAAQNTPVVSGRLPGGLEVHAGGGRGHRRSPVHPGQPDLHGPHQRLHIPPAPEAGRQQAEPIPSAVHSVLTGHVTRGQASRVSGCIHARGLGPGPQRCCLRPCSPGLAGCARHLETSVRACGQPELPLEKARPFPLELGTCL